MRLQDLYFLARNISNWQYGELLGKLVLKDETLTFLEEVSINETLSLVSMDEDAIIDDPIIVEMLSEVDKYVVIALKEVKDKVTKNTQSSLISLTNGASHVFAYLSNKETMKTVKLKLELDEVSNMTRITLIDVDVNLGVELQ